MLSSRLSEIIYNGLWFSPEREFVMSSIDQSQTVVNGTVKLRLYKGNVTVMGRQSYTSLYDEKIASMDESGGFDPSDSEGFIKIQSIRLRAHASQQAKLKEREST